MKLLSNIGVLFSLIGIFASSSVTQANTTSLVHSSHPLKEGAGNFKVNCGIGFYGVFCDLSCNCRNDVACDGLTGHCPDGCALGFKGPICNVCDDGFFGTHCNGTCHCLNGHAACNQTSGYCDGGCAIGYSDPACQNLTGFPQILSISNDDIVNVASTIPVVCTAWGAPDPNITLISKNFTLVEGSSGDYKHDDKKNFYADFHTSNTTGVSQLTCTAVNEHGAANLTFEITTVDPPELKLPPTIIVANAENVSLTWTPWQFGIDKGGAQFDAPEYMVLYRIVGGLNWSPGTSWLVNNFATVEHLMPDSDYEFAIRSKRQGNGGEGPVGQIAQTFTKCRAPTANGKPLNLTATVKSAATVYFQWKAPSLMDIGCFLSKYNLSCSVNGSASSVDADISGSELSYEMGDLQPNSTYICFMYAITSASNLGLHYAEVSFHTPNPVPGPVQHLFQERFASSSRNSLIKWAHPKNLPDRAVQEYLLTAELLTVDSCSGVPPDTNVTNFTTTTNSTQVNLINMHPFSTYYITLRALSKDGQLGEETNLTLQTMQDVPDVKPPKVSSVTENSTTVTFYWDPIPCEKANGKIFYRYSLRSTDEEKIRRRKRSSDYVIKDKETNGTNVTITGLNLNTTYEFAVRGVTTAGEGPLAIIQKKPENVSFTPELAFHNATQSTASIEIITPERTVDEIVGFQLTIQKENDSGNVKEINLEADQISHVITELSPYTTYTIQCRAKVNVSSSEWSDWSKPKIFRTNEGVPMAPDNLLIDQLNASAVMLQWLPPVITNGIIQHYQVLVYNLSESDSVKYAKPMMRYESPNSYSTNVTLDGLEPEGIYEIQVMASTRVGYGKPRVRNFTMDDTEEIGAPEITTCKVFNETTAQVQWKPSTKKTSDPILGYKLEFRILDTSKIPPSPSTEIKPFETDNVTLDFTYDGFLPGKTYLVSVMAKTIKGYSSASSSNFKMAEIDVPDAPNIVDYKIYNSTAIYVEWKPPEIISSTIINYVVEFKPSSADPVDKLDPSRNVITVPTANNATLNITYDGLLPENRYLLSVTAKTITGYSKADSRSFVMTNEKVTAAPNIVSYKIHNSSAVYVQWEAPEYVSDTIIRYKVDFQLLSVKSADDQDSSGTLNSVETPNNATLNITYNGLLPEMTYMLSVMAQTVDGYSKADSRNFTMAGENDSRKVVDILLPPPPPVIIKIIPYESDPSEIAVVVKLFPSKSDTWSPLSDHEVVVAEEGHTSNLNESKIFNYYYAKEHDVRFWIAARLSPKFFSSDSNHEFMVGDKKTYNSFYNGPLRADKKYYVTTRAVGNLPASTSYLSPMAAIATKDEPESVFGPCIVWGISCIWFLLIVIIFLFLFWVILACIIFYQRRKRHGKKKISKNDNKEDVYGKMFVSNKEEEVSPLTVFVQSPDDHAKTDTFKTSDFFGPILLKNLAEYINMRAHHPNLKFQEEFMQATRNKELNAPWNVSKKAANLKKNRYGNILPFDQTRVRLEPLPGQPDSDYINASFIDGYDKSKTYIATQGPKENTFHDFWRMIWQERVTVIVMLTALIEHKKRKCDQYWPNQSRLFGDILVTLTETEHLADIVIRRFEMKLVGNTDIRHVTHYHFSDWPDLGIPPCVTAVLQLRREVREDLPLNSGPIVVHCSGGAGRTGTFIAIDAMLKQAYDEERVYVYDFVHRIQSQRVHLIQTPDQYRFVYDSILEAVQSGDTKVLCSRLPIYYRDISRTSETEPSDLAEQFNILSELEQRKSSFPCPEALNEENLSKNRNQNILPIEHSRVRLLSENGRGSTQNPTEPYINAVLCDGFKQKGQFLVTQMPLDCTIEDFWHMVVRHRSSVIVMLNDCEFIDEHIMPGQYWPNDGCTLYGPFQVDVVAFEEKGMVNCRTLRVLDTRKPDSEPQCVMQLQFLGWAPGDVVPSSTGSVVSLLSMTDVLQRKYGGPITVHCTDGASRSGLFCVSHVLKEQIELGEVDIFTAVKRLRRHRPQFITSLEQYQFCYEVAIELNSERADDSESKMITTSI